MTGTAASSTVSTGHRPGTNNTATPRLDHESFRSWYKDYVSRVEELRAQGERVRAALLQTCEALGQTIEEIRAARSERERAGRRG